MKRKIGEDHEAYNDVIKGTKNWKKASIASGLAHGIPWLCGDPDTYALTTPVWPVPLTPLPSIAASLLPSTITTGGANGKTARW
jgi:hypothetical protein